MNTSEKDKSPAERAWEEYKNLIGLSIPKRINIIDQNLAQNGQTIFSSEVLQEFNNLRNCLNNLQQQYQLGESKKASNLSRLTESKLDVIIRKTLKHVLNNY
jgi:hypothetical protein